MAAELNDVSQQGDNVQDDPYKDLTPKKVLTSPHFHSLAPDVKRHILGKVDKNFFALPKSDQDQALSLDADYWNDYYKEPEKEEPGILGEIGKIVSKRTGINEAWDWAKQKIGTRETVASGDISKIGQPLEPPPPTMVVQPGDRMSPESREALGKSYPQDTTIGPARPEVAKKFKEEEEALAKKPMTNRVEDSMAAFAGGLADAVSTDILNMGGGIINTATGGAVQLPQVPSQRASSQGSTAEAVSGAAGKLAGSVPGVLMGAGVVNSAIKGGVMAIAKRSKDLAWAVDTAIRLGFTWEIGKGLVTNSKDFMNAIGDGDAEKASQSAASAIIDGAFTYLNYRGFKADAAKLRTEFNKTDLADRWRAGRDERFWRAKNVTPGREAESGPPSGPDMTPRAEYTGPTMIEGQAPPKPTEPVAARGTLALGPFKGLEEPVPGPGKPALRQVAPVKTQRPALPPAPGAMNLPGGEPIVSRTTGITPGEEGGLPPFRRIERTLVGPEQGVMPPPPTEPDVVESPRPVDATDFKRMQDRIKMIETGALSRPGIDIEQVKNDLKLAEQRSDYAELRKLRQRLGIEMPGDAELVARRQRIESDDKDVVRGLERLKMLNDRSVTAPPEGGKNLLPVAPPYEAPPNFPGGSVPPPGQSGKLALPPGLETPLAIRGNAITQPAWTYSEATATKPKGSDIGGKNVWVRQSSAPDNSDRTLMVQFSSDLLQTAPAGESGEYYDKLYDKRHGYNRPSDFWEIPQWQAHLAYSVDNADTYVVRDVDEAIKFMNDAGYKNVAFSALDVNQSLIRKIANGYNGKVVVGGYTDMSVFGGSPNVTVFPTIKDFVESEGLPYKEGYDYRLFNGTKTIPRLTMSDGCRHACAFCSVPKSLTEKTEAEIMQQVDSFAKDLPADLIYLNDKTFGQANNHTLLPEVYDRIKQQNPSFQGFVIQTTAAQMKKLSPDFIQKSGIKYIELGIESYNDPILKAHKKPANEKIIQEAADKIREAGAILIPNIMVGLPGETEASYQRTLDWLEKNKDIISHVNVYNLALYAESELGRKIESATDADRDENVTEKSWMDDASVAKSFYKKVMYFGGTTLNRDPANVRILTDSFYGQNVSDVEQAPPLEERLKGKKKTLAVSTKPGGMKAFEVPLEELVARHERILGALGVSKENPKIKQLSDLGLDHKVVQPLGYGTWEGPEPNMRIEFAPDVPYDKVRQAAALIGEGFGQDSVAVSHPDSGTATFAGLKVAKPDGSSFTTEEIDELAKNSKIGFETGPDNSLVVFNKYWPGKDAFVEDTAQGISSIGLSDKNITSYTGDSHLVERSAGQYTAAIAELRDQARAEGRPDLPERVVREFRTALAAGHPEAAEAIRLRRAREAAAEFDQLEISGAGKSPQVGMVGGDNGRSGIGEGAAGAGSGSGLVSPAGWRGLAGAVPVGDIRASKRVEPGPFSGGGGTGDPVSEALDSLTTNMNELKTGQTEKGVDYANRLKSSPEIPGPNGRVLRILDKFGLYPNRFIDDYASDPGLRKVLNLQDWLVHRVNQYLMDAYPGADFASVHYAGENVDSGTGALNTRGDMLFGEGGPNLITTNTMAMAESGFKRISNGTMDKADLPNYLAGWMVEAAFHENMHQYYRKDDGSYTSLLDTHRSQNQKFLAETTQEVAGILGADNQQFIRDIIPTYGKYVRAAAAVKAQQRSTLDYVNPPDNFITMAIESALGRDEIGKGLTPPPHDELIVQPTVDEVVASNVAKGRKTLEDYQTTSAMTDVLARDILAMGMAGSEDDAMKAFAAHHSAKQYPTPNKTEFKQIYKAATIKAAGMLPGLLPEERARLTAGDLVRIYEFGKKINPLIKDMEALSKMGKVTRGWYERANETTTWLASNLPGPQGMTTQEKKLRFVKLIAATSPQQGVKDNFLMALRVWRLWANPEQASDEYPDLKLHPDLVPFDTDPEHLKTLITTSEPEWEHLPNGDKRYVYERDWNGKLLKKIDSETGEKTNIVKYKFKGTVDLEARQNNTITALTDMGKFDITKPGVDSKGKTRRVKIGEEWRPVGGLDLSGFKVTSFARNIMGLYQYMTLDTHMANITDVDARAVGTKGMYLALSNAFRQAASNLGYLPAQQQETSWTSIRALFLLNRRLKMDFTEGLKKITPDLLMEYSANTELATMMLEDRDVRDELESLGILDAVRQAKSDLERTTEIGRDLSDAEEIDPGILESIAERSGRVAARRAAEKAKELSDKGIAREESDESQSSTSAAEADDTDFGFGANAGESAPDIDSPMAKKKLEPPPPQVPNGKVKFTAEMLGDPVDGFEGASAGWILPNGQAVKINQFHYTSLAGALGIPARDVIPVQRQLAAKHGLVRVRMAGTYDDPTPAVEIYGVPTAAQMKSIAQMQREFRTYVMYDLTDTSKENKVIATGNGIGQLRRDIDEKFPDIDSPMAPPGSTPPPGGIGGPPAQQRTGPQRRLPAPPGSAIIGGFVGATGRAQARDLGEAFRNMYTGVRDEMIAETNQIRDKLERTVPDKKQQEALMLFREFRNVPQSDIQALLNGTHPWYNEYADYLRGEGDSPQDILRKVTEAEKRVKNLAPVFNLAVNPTPEMINGDSILSDFFRKKLDEGVAAGFINSSFTPEEYSTHILISEFPPDRGDAKTTNSGGGELPKGFTFAKKRTFGNIVKAIIFDKKPATINTVDAMTIYGNQHAKVWATRDFITKLQESDVLRWGDDARENIPNTWIPYTKSRDARLWKFPIDLVDQTTGKRVASNLTSYGPRKIVEALYPITDPDYFTEIHGARAARAYQAYLKSVQLGLSLFHIKALALSGIANMGPIEVVRALTGDRNDPDWQDGERDAIRNGVTTDVLGRNIEARKRISVDSVSPSKLDKIAELPIISQLRAASRWITDITFGVVQRKMKVYDFALKKAAWIAKNPNATDMESKLALQGIAREINSVYGGLHWENMGWNKTTVNATRAILLAPDWTYSNILSAKYAARGDEGGRRARVFIAAGFGVGMALTATLSLILSGHLPKSPTKVYMGKDKDNKDVQSNVFFSGFHNDVVNLVNNVSDVGLVQGIAQSFGSKASPLLRYAYQVLSKRDWQGKLIVPPGSGLIVGTAKSVWHAMKNLGPVPFSVSTPIDMMFDGKPHDPAEYFLAIAAAARISHADPEDKATVKSGYKKGTLVNKTERQAVNIWDRIAGNRTELPTVSQFSHMTLDSALSAYEVADTETRNKYRPYLMRKAGTRFKYTNPDVKKDLQDRLESLGIINNTQGSLPPPPQ